MPQQPSASNVQQQQAQQAAITALAITAMGNALALIDLADLKTTLPRYRLAVLAITTKYGQASATVAARFYQQERRLAGISGTYRPIPANPAPMEQVAASLDWATKGLWDDKPDLPAVKTLTNGVAQKLIVDTGRNTLIQAIEQDRRARGWARLPRPTCCHFCALLATRGAVYKSEQAAGFEAHDHDHCVPVPLFAEHYEPPAYVREWGGIYADSTSGKHGAEARNAFRVALAAHREQRQPVAV